MKGSSALVTLLAVVLCSPAASAFPLKSVGFKVGYTGAQEVWEHEWITGEEISWRDGIHAGVFTEAFDFSFHASDNMSHHLSLIVGLNYEQKGMEWTLTSMVSPFDPTPVAVTMDFRVDYLSIPIVAKYCLRGERIAPYLLAGPRIDIYLSSDRELGVEDEFNDAVFGLTAGAGIEIPKAGVFLEVVYNHDESWLWEATNEYTGNDIRMKNESFNVSVGYSLKL